LGRQENSSVVSDEVKVRNFLRRNSKHTLKIHLRSDEDVSLSISECSIVRFLDLHLYLQCKFWPFLLFLIHFFSWSPHTVPLVSISMISDQNAKRRNIFRFSVHIVQFSPENKYFLVLYNILGIHVHQYLSDTTSWHLMCNAVMFHKHWLVSVQIVPSPWIIQNASIHQVPAGSVSTKSPVPARRHVTYGAPWSLHQYYWTTIESQLVLRPGALWSRSAHISRILIKTQHLIV
jgi:hypothetical protein